MKKILLVDDEVRMLELLSLYLSPSGFNTIKVKSGMEALAYLKDHQVDLIILDVMMPEMDGWTVCQNIREFSEVPIIMLTARSETDDVVKGLKNGADDYIIKPFKAPELLARIESLLRRTKSTKEHHLNFNGLTWNKDSMELKYNNKLITVTPKEFALIGLFLNNPNKVFSREHLLSNFWGLNSTIDDRTVDSHIRNVREKLRNVGFPIDEHLSTVWGIGYKWIH